MDLNGGMKMSQKMTNYRWIILGLIFVIYTIATADRANIGIAMPYIRKEFSHEQYGSRRHHEPVFCRICHCDDPRRIAGQKARSQPDLFPLYGTDIDVYWAGWLFKFDFAIENLPVGCGPVRRALSRRNADDHQQTGSLPRKKALPPAFSSQPPNSVRWWFRRCAR